GLKSFLTTVFWSDAGAVRRTSKAPGRRGSARLAPAPAPDPRRRMPFPLLAPGKTAALGEHAFWRGQLWGKTVALQGDSSFTKFDLFELAGTQLLYWGTFRGNGYYGSEESHSLKAPFVWLDRLMSVGDFKQQRITDTVLDPRHRAVANSGDNT